eukprot:scaffold128729_cov36-Attheya_sp.AAC.1
MARAKILFYVLSTAHVGIYLYSETKTIHTKGELEEEEASGRYHPPPERMKNTGENESQDPSSNKG